MGGTSRVMYSFGPFHIKTTLKIKNHVRFLKPLTGDLLSPNVALQLLLSFCKANQMEG